jgi:hypothetical protein
VRSKTNLSGFVCKLYFGVLKRGIRLARDGRAQPGFGQRYLLVGRAQPRTLGVEKRD